MASVFVRFSSEALAEGHFFEPDMGWYNVLLHKNRLTKMADLGIIFLRRKHTIHWYQSLFTFITGSMPFRYFWATLYSVSSYFYMFAYVMEWKRSPQAWIHDT